MLFKLLTDAGDEVLIPRPSYPLFEHLASLARVTPRTYDLDPDAEWRIDFRSLEAAITARTRAILVVSPNNPTGSFVKSQEVERLAALAAAHDLTSLQTKSSPTTSSRRGVVTLPVVSWIDMTF